MYLPNNIYVPLENREIRIILVVIHISSIAIHIAFIDKASVSNSITIITITKQQL